MVPHSYHSCNTIFQIYSKLMLIVGDYLGLRITFEPCGWPSRLLGGLGRDVCGALINPLYQPQTYLRANLNVNTLLERESLNMEHVKPRRAEYFLSQQYISNYVGIANMVQAIILNSAKLRSLGLRASSAGFPTSSGS